MTPAELRALLAKATERPWCFSESTANPDLRVLIRGGDDDTIFGDLLSEDDADLACSAVNALPALLDVAGAAQLALDAFDTLIIRLNRENAGTVEAFNKLEAARDALRGSLARLGSK